MREMMYRESNKLNIYIYICVCSHPQTETLYHNYSVWLDRLDTLRWDRNPLNFMLD